MFRGSRPSPRLRSPGMPWLRRLGGIVVLGLVVAGCGGNGEDEAGVVSMTAVDDEFAIEIVQIPVGGTVRWNMAGNNPHNVFALDLSWSSPQVMQKGDSFERVFTEPGIYSYFCTFHGTTAGDGMAGHVVVGDVPPEDLAALGKVALPAVADPSGVIRQVPGEFATIQAAVDASGPGDLILVGEGVYSERVLVDTPSLVIRGVDRNRVILDGNHELVHGFQVVADGVAIENMTARNYLVNGFYWTGVTGYRASYLTAYNNGDYGIYAFDAVDGLIEDSYASGNVDSGFYIGQCYPCSAVVRNVIAEDNALGFSGTNAGGDLYLIESVWRNNMGGIVPNSLDSELDPPHRETTIVGNLVIDNSNRNAPTKGFARLAYGNGIVLGGGVGDVVERNLVLNHARFGIVAAPLPDKNFWWSQDSVVRDNVVGGSGLGDLALVGPWGPGNCFEGNTAGTTKPLLLQVFHRCSGLRLPLQADLGLTALLLGAQADSASEWPPGSDHRTYPAPADQPTMPLGADAPVRPAVDVFEKPDLEAIGVPPVPAGFELRTREVTMSGVPVSEPTAWTLLFSMYAYFLPFALFATWVAVAAWDLVRREDVTPRRTVGWLAVILLVPFLGAVLYYLFGRSEIPRWLRGALVGGGFGAYLIIVAVAAVLGGVV